MAELRDAIIAYGSAIRLADPAAVLVGPEEWGWMGYFWSGYDQQHMSATGCWTCWPDRDANGSMEFMPWLLGQLRQHEQTTGVRLLDVFSLHYCPQGGEFSDDTSAAMQAHRNRSTRSLWDPNYVDETWINDRVRLIPRMREWVSTYYPGRDTAITEYSWGAESHINGATTQADVLGIFGREGLNLGTRRVVPDTGTATFKAFQMHRNYDGNGSTFGDTSVQATVANPDNVAAFAAERTSDGALTVMAINKTTSGTPATIAISGFSPGPAAQVWQLRSTNAIERLADVGLSGASLSTTLPAQSITLFVIPRVVIPSLSIGDVTLDEGQSGIRNAVFTVTLSASSTQTATVNYATANGSATASVDYTATSGTATFAAGETSRTIAVPVLGDTAIEGDETFTLTLSGAVNATISRAQGTATIRNDDVPALSIGDATVSEGNPGATSATFTVSLSAPSPQVVTINYATADGTATAGSDYVAQTGNLSFAAGQTSRTVAISVTGDTTAERDETFSVTLSSPNGATLGDAQGQGTTSDDDSAPPPPATDPVVWTSAAGVTLSGNSLTKTAANGWGNAGAISTQTLVSGDGYVELTASETNTYRLLGLANGDTDTSYQDIDFAIDAYAGGQIQVWESGVYKGTYDTFVTGDKLRIGVVGGVVQYFKNGVLVYTSTKAPAYPLLVDAALYNTGSTLNDAVIGGAQ